jgi:hypothetical protein
VDTNEGVENLVIEEILPTVALSIRRREGTRSFKGERCVTGIERSLFTIYNAERVLLTNAGERPSADESTAQEINPVMS